MFTGFSCNKNKNELPVEFMFRLLDENGTIKTLFNEGENVIFSFVIVNKTKEDLFFYHSEMNTNDFFRLYKIDSLQGKLDLGKPYDYIFCEMIGALMVPVDSVLKIEIPWLWDENQSFGYIGCPNDNYHSITFPLTTGDYKTAFSSHFRIGNIQTEEKHFEIRFTVK